MCLFLGLCRRIFKIIVNDGFCIIYSPLCTQVLHAENEALSSPGSGQPSIAEMLVEIMEAIFTEASLEPPERQKVRLAAEGFCF